MQELEILNKKLRMRATCSGVCQKEYRYIITVYVVGRPVTEAISFKYSQPDGPSMSREDYWCSLSMLAMNAAQTEISYEQFASRWVGRRTEQEIRAAYQECQNDLEKIRLIFPDLDTPWKLHLAVCEILDDDKTSMKFRYGD